jgi:hypothetical protein
MGKHAAPRTPLLRGRTAQRAVAVSAGTLVLCLGAAAPAVATTGLPTPPPLPQPIVDTVQTVTDIVGVPNPIAVSTKPKAHHHRAGAKHETTKAQLPLAHRDTTKNATPPKAEPATPAYSVPTMSVSGLRAMPTTSTARIDGRAPSMADAPPTVTRIMQTAGQQALGAIPTMPPSQDTGRILLVALAMTIVGGLTSGHIKAVQSRSLA